MISGEAKFELSPPQDPLAPEIPGKERETSKNPDHTQENFSMLSTTEKLQFIQSLYAQYGEAFIAAESSGYGGSYAFNQLDILSEKIDLSQEPPLVQISMEYFSHLANELLADYGEAWPEATEFDPSEQDGYARMIELPDKFIDDYTPTIISRDFVALRSPRGDLRHFAPLSPDEQFRLPTKNDIAILGHLTMLFEHYTVDQLVSAINSIVDILENIDDERIKSLLQEAKTLGELAPKVLNSWGYLPQIQVSADSVRDLEAIFPSANTDQKKLFQEIHKPQMRRIIESTMQIATSRLSLQSQFWLLTYLGDVQDVKQFRKLIDQIQTIPDQDQKIHFLQSFLSLEHGGQEMGEHILAIAERIDPEVATQIFARYGEIVDAAMGVENILQRDFPEELERTPQAAACIQNILLDRGKNLLVQFAERSQTDTDPQELLAQLESAQADILLQSATFRTLKDLNEDITFEDIQEMHKEVLTGPELAEDRAAVQSMETLYRANYPDPPYPQGFQDYLLEGFRARLKNSQVRFYTVRHKDAVIAFDAFTTAKDGSVYFGAMNVLQSANGSKLGQELLQQSLEVEALEAPIIAEAIPDTPIARSYIQTWGFVGRKVQDVQGGVPLLEIHRPQGPREEVVRLYKSKKLKRSTIVQALEDTNSLHRKHLLLQKTSERSPDLSPLDQGYILTQFFTKDGSTYTVFEKDLKVTRSENSAST